MLRSTCYDSVYQVSGVLQQYMLRCVVGGRVMSATNKMYHDENKVGGPWMYGLRHLGFQFSPENTFTVKVGVFACML